MEMKSYFRKAVLAGSGLIAVYAMPSSLESMVYADDAVAANPDPNKKVQPAEKSLEEKVLDRINYYRNIAGLDPVTLDPELSKACQAHANYLMVNGISSTTHSLDDVHSEDPRLRGYTKEGAKIAKFCNIGYEDPEIGIEGIMRTLFHRIPILKPNLKAVGIGYKNIDRKGRSIDWYNVISFRSIKPKEGLRTTINFPADNQKEVPIFYDWERPDPIPEDTDKLAGIPITLTFYDWNYPKECKGNLKKLEYIKTKGGNKLEKTDIPFWFSSPEQPANKEMYQGPTICLITKDPLEHDTTYEVKIIGKLDNQPWEKTWQFTTVKSSISETVMPKQK